MPDVAEFEAAEVGRGIESAMIRRGEGGGIPAERGFCGDDGRLILLRSVVGGGSIAPSFSITADLTAPTFGGATVLPALLAEVVRSGALTGASVVLSGVALRLEESEVAEVRPETEVAREGRPATELRAESGGRDAVGDTETEEGRRASLADPLDEVGDWTESISSGRNSYKEARTRSC